MKRLFEKISTEEIDEKSYTHKVHIQVGIQKSQKKFVFEFTAQDYVNFSKSHVYAKLQVVNRDGSPLVDGEQVSVINCLGLTFIKQLNVSAQNKSLMNHHNVDYISYFEQQLSCNENASKSWCQTHLMFQDKHNEMDTLSEANLGWKMRGSFIKIQKLWKPLVDLPFFLSHVPTNISSQT